MLSAGVVIVRRDPTCRVLLLRAYNYWDFPKGGVEAGESSLEAAVREVREETGITELAFSWGEEFRDTPPYARGKIARYYLAETKTVSVVLGISPLLGRPEHHEFRWASFDEASNMTVPRLQSIITWARRLTGC
jgi:8-oxo-dGTP pyrophosphatase MutT (NUDIX family)